MKSPRTVVLFGRDLRIRDHEALFQSARRGAVVPLFVFDDALLRSKTMGANRLSFLIESLGDLRASLRQLGSDLVVRRGEPGKIAVQLARSVGASTVAVSHDFSPWNRRSMASMKIMASNSEIVIERYPGISVVDLGSCRTRKGTPYRVFTPFFRSWLNADRRLPLPDPGSLSSPSDLDHGVLLDLEGLLEGNDPLGLRDFDPIDLPLSSPRRQQGGETRAVELANKFLESGLNEYDKQSNKLGGIHTARLGAHLHFGTISPLWMEARLNEIRGDGAQSVVRQLCWREFFMSLLSAFPHLAYRDFQPRATRWRVDENELDAWKKGTTGVDIVDAAMRQLLEEGFMPNRARLITASYLTRTLEHHWREGADHFSIWLTDADVANNAGNWQWMAGTGTDRRPNRALNPVRQADRFDGQGHYRSRYLRERPLLDDTAQAETNNESNLML